MGRMKSTRPSDFLRLACDQRSAWPERGTLKSAPDGTDWSDVTFIHATRWQDEPLAQISYGSYGYPKENRSKAWELWRDRGAHVSIAVLIEMQMRPAARAGKRSRISGE
jgi:hypothetical protein